MRIKFFKYLVNSYFVKSFRPKELNYESAFGAEIFIYLGTEYSFQSIRQLYSVGFYYFLIEEVGLKYISN